MFLVIESGRADLNRRPLAPEASALPCCATPRKLTARQSAVIRDQQVWGKLMAGCLFRIPKQKGKV
jgi:hypothetical protein